MMGGIREAPSLASIPGVISMRGYANHYRIRIGNYRLGVVVDGDTAILFRFMHRREMYRYFP